MPIRLNADNILALLRGELEYYQERTVALRSDGETEEYPLVKSPQYPIVSPKQQVDKLEFCPVCSGKIKYISETDAFCLDCDWDNLVPLGK